MLSRYQQRYDYQPIPRTTVEGRRLYTTPEGHAVPSVTTILSATTPEEKKKVNEREKGNEKRQRKQRQSLKKKA